MKKTYIIVAMLLLTILASCGKTEELVSNEAQNNVVAQETTVIENDTVIEEVSNEPVVLASGFVEYDESYLGESESTVLFFHSAGCSSCRATEENLKETGVSEGTTVLKIDFDADENFELRKKYGVTTYHTFVEVDADGNEIKKWGGSLSDADIQEQLSSVDGEVMEKSESGDVMEKDDSEELESVSTDSIEEEVVEEVVEEQEPVALGSYSDYSDELLGSTENTVIFFHAGWCPSCRSAEDKINAGEVPADLTILKADYDSETELKKKYGVVAQHTFVEVDADGNEIKKWVGGSSIEDIVEQIQ